MSCSDFPPETHLLPIENDDDEDYLTDSIEYYFNLDCWNPDSDEDGMLDGVQLAKGFYGDIEYLPRHEIKYGPYVIEEIIYGQKICPICGKSINLGRVRIINPVNNLADTIPFIGLHYLNYGSFKYQGEVHKGEINPVKIYNTLNSIIVLAFSRNWKNRAFLESWNSPVIGKKGVRSLQFFSTFSWTLDIFSPCPPRSGISRHAH